MSLTYYCAAPGCEEEGKHWSLGRLLCDKHDAMVEPCTCEEGWTHLLPGEFCGKCDFTNKMKNPAGK
jgi:hypothetical protein